MYVKAKEVLLREWQEFCIRTNTYILLPIVVLICQMESKLSLVYCSALLCSASLTCLHELACMPTTKPTRTKMPSPRVKQEKSKQVLNSRISTGKYLSVSDAAVALECLVLKQIKNNNDNNKKTWLSLLLLPKQNAESRYPCGYTFLPLQQ